MKTEHLLKWFRVNNKATSNEAGQSIVLIALALIGLVAFMGIAIDVGFIFARGSQLQAAIDSAALAGVTELGSWSSNNQTGPEAAARTKSAQFLNANGMPLSVTTSLNQSSNLHVEIDPLGATEYSISATWPVETFFLNVIGFDQDINLTRSATAAVFSLANIYASRRIEDGVLSTSNQSVFGQNICTSYGDPFSPINSLWNPGPYSYEYRIMIPPHYPSNILRVELFDPDSINASSNGPFSIPRTDAAINAGLPPLLDNQYCSNADQKNACLIDTNELSLVPSLLTLDQINPYFFWRIDENRGAGSAPGNGNCGSPLSYDATFNTRTLYQLYYFMQNPDGTTQRIDLASYTGQVDDGTRDNGDHHTDMHWVSPGAAQQAFDYPIDPNTNQPYNVPVDAGSTRTF
ncbi:MAG: hypothetical protein GY796_24185, partial [Chloroflexi bacterium]|nr:hypothetical protein [Chloroflexota bacterium]